MAEEQNQVHTEKSTYQLTTLLFKETTICQYLNSIKDQELSTYLYVMSVVFIYHSVVMFYWLLTSCFSRLSRRLNGWRELGVSSVFWQILKHSGRRVGKGRSTEGKWDIVGLLNKQLVLIRLNIRNVSSRLERKG